MNISHSTGQGTPGTPESDISGEPAIMPADSSPAEGQGEKDWSRKDETGLGPRLAAANIVDEGIRSGQSIEELTPRYTVDLSPRDRSLARAIATVTFRRLGTLDRALSERMLQGLPDSSTGMRIIMLTAAAQLLFLDVPDHAAVDCAVRLIGEDKRRAGLRGFANAVLRRVARERAMILAGSDALADDTPAWLGRRWIKTYGETRARAIAEIHGQEPPLDITVKSDAEDWAAQLDGLLLPSGSIRLKSRAAIETLPGYAEGQWWVQDAAASLPARFLKAQAGERVADLCAAPGGKTMQLAATGAHVTAVDRSRPRMARLRENLARTSLTADIMVTDAATLSPTSFPSLFDAVLVDAPCSATGTIRRHPDVAWSKREEDMPRLAALQARLLDNAIELTRTGGRIVYCTCSLESEEGEAQISALLARRRDVRREAITLDEVGGIGSALTADGDLRTTPEQLPNTEARLAGWAGFYACRLVKL
jgi:16S rRNA (cytosine967-C5)-methyltransferase